MSSANCVSNSRRGKTVANTITTWGNVTAGAFFLTAGSCAPQRSGPESPRSYDDAIRSNSGLHNRPSPAVASRLQSTFRWATASRSCVHVFPPWCQRVHGVLPISPRETRFPMAYSHPYMNPMIWRTIMKIDTPLHTDHQLDQLAGQFEHWRRTRSHPSERIPQRLWKQAAALARVLPSSRVAQHVRVSPSDLKKHMATPHDARLAAFPTPPRFVQVPPMPAWPPATQAMEIELKRPDGARLRLRCPESPLPVAALLRRFLEVS